MQIIYTNEPVTARLCKLCNVFIKKTAKTCEHCLLTFHPYCFKSPDHICVQCIKCQMGLCIQFLKQPMKFLEPKSKPEISIYNPNFPFYDSANLSWARELINSNFLRKNILKVEIKNEYCDNEAYELETNEGQVTVIYNKLYFTRKCIVCCNGFHSSRRDFVCNDCLHCHNCYITCKKYYVYKVYCYKNKMVSFRNFIYCTTCYYKFVLNTEMCPTCFQGYENDDMLECTFCYRWIHFRCEPEKGKWIGRNANKDYYCKSCKYFNKLWIEKQDEKKEEKAPTCYYCKIDYGSKKESLLRMLEINGTTPRLYAHNICVYSNVTHEVKDFKYYINLICKESSIECEENFYDFDSNNDELKNDCLIVNGNGNAQTKKVALNYNIKTNIILPKKFKFYLNYKKINSESKKCKKCKKPGAIHKCILCTDKYYHYDCTLHRDCTLYRSNFTIPICFKHFYEIDKDGDVANIKKYLNKYAILLNNADFLLDYSKDSKYARCEDFILSNEGYFKRIFYLEKSIKILRFDFFHLDFDNKRMLSSDVEQELKNYNIIESLDEILMDGYNYLRKAFAINLNFNRYNPCLPLKYQKENANLSFISSKMNPKDFYVKKSQIHGLGLFTRRAFFKGEILLQYTGQEIDVIESNKKEKEYDNFYMFKTANGYVIDATVVGGIAKFINQSCDPNCYSTHALWGNKKGVLIVTCKVISADEELTYDYKFKGSKLHCTCGSMYCRTTMN